MATGGGHDSRDRKPAFRWPVSDEKPETLVSRRIRQAIGGVLLIGAALSLVISPISWPLFLIYAGIGLVVGLLEEFSTPTAVVGYLILVFGVQGVATALNRAKPEWHAAWWQPVLIAAAVSLLVYLIPKAVRRSR